MESKDIIKALEYCTSLNADCRHCDEKITENCITFLMRDALYLIKNQQAEIENLQLQILNGDFTSATAEKAKIDWHRKNVERQKRFEAEIERLKAECVELKLAFSGAKKVYVKAKAEAYKEFAELVKNRMFKGKKYDYERKYIDNLAKELTERKED